MKRRDLIKILEAHGCRMIRDRGGHSIFSNGAHEEPIPRHREIKEHLARAILKRFGIEDWR
jgi:predicted RNA binding protein YcfA (HicA-like mRNA interferase family)